MNKKLTLLAAGVFAGLFSLPVSAQTPCFQALCPPAIQTICDESGNDLVLWHHVDWWDPATQSNNLADAEVNLSIQVEETCTQTYTVEFDLLLDLDGDGILESQINSANLADIPAGYAAFNNYPDPAKLEYRVFDLRSVAPEENYRFALQTNLNGNVREYRIAWNTEQAPGDYLPLQLPYGKHQINWKVFDDAGNQEVCQSNFEIKDCKKPTVVCINGLSINIMPSGMINLWASDFIQYAEDNYTPANSLELGLRKTGTGSGFPTDPTGGSISKITFQCNELGPNSVELWVRDAAGNTQYCETEIIVQDNLGFCSLVEDTVTLCLSYCKIPFPLMASFYLEGNHPALPPINMFEPPLTVNPDGCIKRSLLGVPFLGDYSIAPSKDSDPLNGVSTYDLILIAQHLLGQPSLDSPYKMIAADIDNSRSVTATDIAELRKLVLGIYSELPNNTSWRFVPSDFVFPGGNNPFTTIFPETIQASNAADTVHFESVKVGDVTCNATPSGQLPQRETLSPGKEFCINLAKVNLGPGKTILLPISAGTAGPLLGYQLELNIASPLSITQIIPGPGQTLDNFALIGNVLSCSWSSGTPVDFKVGDVLFTLEIKASSWVNTQTALSLQNNRIYAESYNTMGMYKPLALCFTGGQLPSEPSTQIILQPNPVTDRTFIIAPDDANGRIRWEVLDFSGRLLLSGSELAQPGQSIELPVQTLPVGVYLYRLWLGDVVQAGKLIKM